ncbi:hypothetical protein ACTHQF_06635 [Pedobacter sp. SAFR-022]|uniref:hypothetical protein n=1 Tax=Pedobacter sp. SAFR-022 TaxID=3436861 RepID=UPI003F7CEF44
MNKSQKIESLMQVLKGRAPKSILKRNKLLFRRGSDTGRMFLLNGSTITLSDVFSLLYTDDTFEVEVTKQ